MLNFANPALAATSGINDTMNFQGRLLSNTGAVVADGNYNMEFKLYAGGPGNVAGDTGGTLLWTEDWLNNTTSIPNTAPVVVKNGYFSLQLGTITALPSSVTLDNATVWLSMTVANGSSPNGATSTTCTTFAGCNSSSEPEMLPMKSLSAAPFALNADNANQVNSYGYNNNFLDLAVPGAPTLNSTSGSHSGTLDYVVTATNAQGETLPSSCTAETGDSGIIVSWAQVSGATGYKIYRNTSCSFTAGSLLLTTISGGQNTTFTDGSVSTTTGLPPTTVTGTTLTLQAWNSQTAKLLQLENSAGGNLLSVDPSGNGIFAGSVTSVGVNSGTGQIQGTGGLTLTGTVQINVTGSGTTTIGSTSAGTVSIQGGTAGTTVNDTSGNLTLSTTTSGTLAVTSAAALNLTSGGANNIALTPGSGVVTIVGTTPSLTSTGTNPLAVDTAGAATLSLGDANATTIDIGSSSSAASTIVIGKNGKTGTLSLKAGGGTLNLSTDGADSNVVNVSNSNFSVASKTYTINIGNPTSTTTTGDQVNTTIGPAANLSGGTVTGATILQADGESDTITGSATNPTDILQTVVNSNTALAVQNAASDNVLGVSTVTSNSSLGMNNPSFETGTTGWAARATCTLTQSNAFAMFGSDSGLCTDGATPTAATGFQYNMSLATGQTYTLSFYARGSVSGNNLTFGYANNGVETTYQDGGNFLSGTAWNRYQFTFTPAAPTGSTYLYFEQNDTTQRNWYIDGVQIEIGSGASDFQDGNLQLGVINGPLDVQPSSSSGDGTALIINQPNTAQTPLLIANTTAFVVGVGAGNVINNLFAVGVPTTTDFNATTMLASASTTKSALTVEAASGQTANVFEVQNSSGTDLVSVGNTGSTTITTPTNNSKALQIQGSSGATLFTADTTTSNLISNPSFLSGTTGWAQVGTGAAISQNTTQIDSYDGQTSLNVTTGTVANSSGTQVGAQVTGFTGSITPGTYSFSFYARANSGNFADLNTILVGGSAPACTYASSTVVTTNWNRYYCSFTTTTTNLTSITIGESGTTSHTLWVSGVQLISGNASNVLGARASLNGTLVVDGGPQAATAGNSSGYGLLVEGSGSGALNDIPLSVQTPSGSIIAQISSTTNSSSFIGGNTFWGTAALNASAGTGDAAGTQIFNVQNSNGGSMLDSINATVNLVTNSTWFIQTLNPVTGWTFKGTSGDNTMTTDSTNAFVAQASAKDTVTTAASQGMQTSTFNATITPTTQYQMTFWAKCSSSITTFTYGRQDVSGTDINSTTTASCGTTWTQYTSHWTTGGTITNPDIYVDMGATTSGSFWIDGVQLVQTTTSAATNYEQGDLYVDSVIKSPVIFENSGNSVDALQVENSSGSTMMSLDDTQGGTGLNATTPVISGITSAAVPTESYALSGTSVTVSPHTIGNLMILEVEYPSSGTYISGLNSNDVSTWHMVSQHDDVAHTSHDEIWEGTVTATTASQAINITFAGGAPAFFTDIVAQEFTDSLGSNTDWTVDNYGSQYNATTATYPTLNAAATGEMYWGYAWCSSTCSAGSTTGFTYAHLSGEGGEVAYDTNVTAGSYGPTATITSAATDTQGIVIGATLGTALSVQGSTNISVDSPNALSIQDGANDTIFNFNTENRRLTINSEGIPLILNETDPNAEDGILFQSNSNVNGEIGVANSTGQIINQTNTGDLAIKSTSNAIWFSANNGSTETEEIDTSGNLIIGKGSSALGGEGSGTIAKLLILDNSTDATKPTEQDGAMYYNPNTGGMECGENTTWLSCGAGIAKVVGLTASQQTASSLGYYNWGTQGTGADINYDWTAPFNDCASGSGTFASGAVYQMDMGGYTNAGTTSQNFNVQIWINGSQAAGSTITLGHTGATAYNAFTAHATLTCVSSTSLIINGYVLDTDTHNGAIATVNNVAYQMAQTSIFSQPGGSNGTPPNFGVTSFTDNAGGNTIGWGIGFTGSMGGTGAGAYVQSLNIERLTSP